MLLHKLIKNQFTSHTYVDMTQQGCIPEYRSNQVQRKSTQQSLTLNLKLKFRSTKTRTKTLGLCSRRDRQVDQAALCIHTSGSHTYHQNNTIRYKLYSELSNRHWLNETTTSLLGVLNIQIYQEGMDIYV